MRDQVVKTRGKAIIIDGNALFNIMRIIGIGQWKDKELYDLLISCVGTSPPFGKPYITCKPEHTTKKKTLELIGYDVELAESRGGYDDLCIRKRIQSFSSNEVDEIIFVGADEDMVADLLKCAECGIRVTFVATLNEDPQSGRLMLAGHLQELIESGTFSFYELADKKDELMRMPWIERESQEQQFDRRSARFQPRIASPITIVQRKGKSVSFTFSGYCEGPLAALLTKAGELADQYNLILTVDIGASEAIPINEDTVNRVDEESAGASDVSTTG